MVSTQSIIVFVTVVTMSWLMPSDDAFTPVSTSARCTTSPSSSRVVVVSMAGRDGSGENKNGENGGVFGIFGKMMEEMDAFVDDAMARRLGNGAAFYGKRKSSFYGAEDANRKVDKSVFDPLEDYQGPSSAGFFKWMPDEDGQLRPVTRLKNQLLERKSRAQDD